MISQNLATRNSHSLSPEVKLSPKNFWEPSSVPQPHPGKIVFPPQFCPQNLCGNLCVPKCFKSEVAKLQIRVSQTLRNILTMFSPTRTRGNLVSPRLPTQCPNGSNVLKGKRCFRRTEDPLSFSGPF